VQSAAPTSTSWTASSFWKSFPSSNDFDTSPALQLKILDNCFIDAPGITTCPLWIKIRRAKESPHLFQWHFPVGPK
jgi:hypothetical protein